MFRFGDLDEGVSVCKSLLTDLTEIKVLANCTLESKSNNVDDSTAITLHSLMFCKIRWNTLKSVISHLIDS